MRIAERPAARPFLKWAGGKRQLLPVLRRFYPSRFRTYFEPFLGSAAVLFDLHARGLLDGRRVVLSDRNADLVGCYRMIREDVEAVIAELEQLERGHLADPREHFYGVRDGEFNVVRQRIAASGVAIEDAYTPRLAALLIYLNRTGFNGLFRLNSAGGFNVPMGRYAKPRICDAVNLRHAAAVLRGPGTEILQGSFDVAVERARAGDFLYFDPPYAPISRTASFTGYTAGGFTSGDQQRLQRAIVTLARRGCHVLLSNSTAPEIAELYATNAEARAAGLRAYEVPARRAINSNVAQRGAVMEFVITNVAPGSGE